MSVPTLEHLCYRHISTYLLKVIPSEFTCCFSAFYLCKRGVQWYINVWGTVNMVLLSPVFSYFICLHGQIRRPLFSPWFSCGTNWLINSTLKVAVDSLWIDDFNLGVSGFLWIQSLLLMSRFKWMSIFSCNWDRIVYWGHSWLVVKAIASCEEL